MTFKVFDALPQEARDIREEVFIHEQGFENEYDGTDETALHFVLYDENGCAAAVCRAFTDGGSEYHIGRLAVKKEYRGARLGAELLSLTEQYLSSLGAQSVALSAQTRVSGFYEKQGYHKCGGIYYDEFCPHILMKKSLLTSD